LLAGILHTHNFTSPSFLYKASDSAVFLLIIIFFYILPLGSTFQSFPSSRPGLSARQPLFGASNAPPNDQLAINMESGNAYDLDDDIMDLRDSVGRLKQVSSAIQEENHLTKQVMDGLESAMETARLTLKQTVKRLDRVARKTKSNHVVYVFLFGIALFFIAYFFSRVHRFLKWLF
jgi:hypothetical protein